MPLQKRSMYIALTMLAFAAIPAMATTGTYTLGPNLGVVNYTINHSTGNCSYMPPNSGTTVFVTYSIDTYSSTYVNSAANINQALPSFTYLYGSPGPNAGANDNCPTPSPTNAPFATYRSTTPGSAYTINLYPGLNAVISVPGYINPKYQVVGIIYAPPGHSSSVDYINSNLVSSTTTTKHSYKNGYTVSNKTDVGYFSSGKIGPFKLGGVDINGNVSASYAQSTTTTDSTATTVQKQTSFEDGPFPGPACDYCGVDHDYDIIKVWLNPVELFTLTNGGVVQPNGVGFSSWDQPGMDVYSVLAGELNGDLQMRSSTVNAFARSWAGASNGFSYASGDGPGLTAQDEVNILLLDPYWNCTYKSAVSDGIDCAKPADASFSGSVNTSGTAVTWASGSTFNQLMSQGAIVINGVTYAVASVNSATSLTLTSSAGTQSRVAYSASSRFTQSGNVNFAYTQPPPGGQPATQSYTWTYQNTNTTGTGYSHDTEIKYGIETVFGFHIFSVGFTDTVTQTWDIDDTYETTSQITTTNTSQATAKITEPVCNNVSGACSPVYPPLNAYNPISCSPLSLATAFGQGTTMYLYQDNLFGTFMFEPFGQP
jgi:hypothetical protein